MKMQAIRTLMMVQILLIYVVNTSTVKVGTSMNLSSIENEDTIIVSRLEQKQTQAIKVRSYLLKLQANILAMLVKFESQQTIQLSMGTSILEKIAYEMPSVFTRMFWYLDFPTFTNLYTSNRFIYRFLAQTYEISGERGGLGPNQDMCVLIFLPRHYPTTPPLPRPMTEWITFLHKTTDHPQKLSWKYPFTGSIEYYPPPCQKIDLFRDNLLYASSNFIQATVYHDFLAKTFQIKFSLNHHSDGGVWQPIVIDNRTIVPWGFMHKPTQEMFTFARFDLRFVPYFNTESKTFLIFYHGWSGKRQMIVNVIYSSIVTPAKELTASLLFTESNDQKYLYNNIFLADTLVFEDYAPILHPFYLPDIQ